MKQMWILIAVLLVVPVHADSLADWHKTFPEPATQRKILERVFPGQIGDAPPVKTKDGRWQFPKQSRWVAIDSRPIWNSSFLVITALIYSTPGQPPQSAASYLIRNPSEPPLALSDGWAGRENVESVSLPLLKKSFMLLEDVFLDKEGKPVSSRAALLDVSGAGYGGGLRTVWMSGRGMPFFELGFVPRDQGLQEDLVVRSIPAPGQAAPSAYETPPAYAAYRWTGDHFESEDFSLDTWLKSLPADTWKYSPTK